MHKITNSYGVYDAYKNIRKHKWFNIGRPLLEKEFYAIIRKCNALMAENLTQGKPITLPKRLGTLELRKVPKRIFLEQGQYKTNLPVDWKSTRQLWEEDAEAAQDKILIRYELNEIFKIIYNKHRAIYNNVSFIKFKPHRAVKQALVKEIYTGHIDAFLFK